MMLEEPVLETKPSDTAKRPPKERMDEMARAMERHPMEFVAVASVVGPVLALALGGRPAAGRTSGRG